MQPGSYADSQPKQRRVNRLFGQYVIKHRFQFKFSLMIFAFLAIASFVVWVEGHYAVKNMIETNMITDDQVKQNLELLNKIIAQTSFLALSVAFGLAIFFSHFIAGPIYRFEKILEEMKLGNLSLHVRLRKHDEFKETAELFNQALASLRIKVQKERDAIQISVERINDLSQQLKSAGRTDEALQLDHLIADIKNIPPQIKI